MTLVVRRLPLVLLLAGSAVAGEPASKPAAPAAPSSISAVAFLAGSWRASAAGSSTEEHWLAPKAGLMVGMNRQVAKGEASFEFLRIEERGGGVWYLASPGGAPPTPFRLVEAGTGRAVFANPEHDFPKRILYTLAGDTLTARVEGDGGEGMEWTWTRGALVE